MVFRLRDTIVSDSKVNLIGFYGDEIPFVGIRQLNKGIFIQFNCTFNGSGSLEKIFGSKLLANAFRFRVKKVCGVFLK